MEPQRFDQKTLKRVFAFYSPSPQGREIEILIRFNCKQSDGLIDPKEEGICLADSDLQNPALSPFVGVTMMCYRRPENS